jgi:hypothetical protein
MGSPDNLPNPANTLEPTDHLPVADQTSSTIRRACRHELAGQSLDERVPGTADLLPACLCETDNKNLSIQHLLFDCHNVLRFVLVFLYF